MCEDDDSVDVWGYSVTKEMLWSWKGELEKGAYPIMDISIVDELIVNDVHHVVELTNVSSESCKKVLDEINSLMGIKDEKV